tara:strand:- start:433 stop:2916 length:2484 start_codon:yes stop_codon:yes gene_type:complete
MTRRKTNPKIKAILGPTNTGKTHQAINMMLSYDTGMIGVPLRLLARELYDKISSKIGAQWVALITGEEKYIPKFPKYYICTVEAMPTDIPVEFVAIDEIQLANDIERGHIFTKRIFEARGSIETIFLGSETIEMILRRIIPDIEVIKKTRFSKLTYENSKKISRLRKRTAIIAFSINRVYEIADFVRQQNGGAAVVLGALSPRTRNAQVELYQSGEADYLVATDAIGMGLNMDIDHIAFDSIKKFDGNKYRYLYPHEVGQIAGRAGRYMNNGTFCMTYPNPELDPNIVSSVENHKFATVDNIKWRNSNIKFNSLTSMLDSLNSKPDLPYLKSVKPGEDQQTLEYINENKLLKNRELEIDELRLLWELCQIPDYRQTGIDNHAKIVLKIFCDITESDGYVDEDWFDKEVKYCAKYNGDIDGLSNKISFIRTCNFIANKSGWIRDAKHWQKKTRAIEDKLSDKLHDRLMQRFIDKRTSILVNYTDLKNIKVDEKNKINVGNIALGTVEGLKFKHQSTAKLNKSAKSKLNNIIHTKINEQARNILMSDNTDFQLSNTNELLWKNMPIATISRSSNMLLPKIRLLADDYLDVNNRKKLHNKLMNWLSFHIKKVLPGLVKFNNAKLKSPLSAIQFSIIENLGVIQKSKLGIEFDQLTKEEKKELRSYGIFIGENFLYFKKIFEDNEFSLRLKLYNINVGNTYALGPIKNERIIENKPDTIFYQNLGYFYSGRQYIRPDLIENVLCSIREKMQREKSSKFILDNELIKKMELKKNITERLLRDLNFTKVKNTKKDKDQFWIKKKINEMPYSDFEHSEINPFSVLKKFNNASNH